MQNSLFIFNKLVKDIKTMDTSARKELAIQKQKVIYSVYHRYVSEEAANNYAGFVCLIGTQVVCGGRSMSDERFEEIWSFFTWIYEESISWKIREKISEPVNQNEYQTFKKVMHGINITEFHMEVYAYMIAVACTAGIDNEAIQKVKNLFTEVLMMA